MNKEDVVHTYNKILLSHKKIMPSAATWMDIEILILSEMLDTENQMSYDIA